MQTQAGQSCFSVLLFQDIAVIPMLAVLPLLAVVSSQTGGADAHAGPVALSREPHFAD